MSPTGQYTADLLHAPQEVTKNHILYLICHGRETSAGTTLYLVSDDELVVPVTGDQLSAELRTLNAAHRPLLAVLLACESASQEAAPLATVAPLLARAGIPAVVAMQAPISMEAGAQLTERLLQELMRDGQIDRALAAARKDMGPDWWIPVLWLRWRDGRLWVDPTERMSASYAASRLSSAELRDRAVILNRVHSTWVQTWLADVRDDGPRLPVKLLEVPEVVERPMVDRVLELSRISKAQARARETLNELLPAFERFNSLLVLGEAGSGKTTLLVELLERLIGRARQDLTAPIPVLLLLSSWAGEPVEEWAVTELAMYYQVPQSVSTHLIRERGLTLLLDGLDELPLARRAPCVVALNNYLRQTTAGLVVSCRRGVYDEVRAEITLACRGAVMVQPLDEADIRAFLKARPLPKGVTAETLETPLLMAIYRRIMETEPEQEEVAEKLLPNRLWPAYIDACFERGKRPRFGRSEVEHWLKWLAQGMRHENQRLLLIEQIQPEWMSNDAVN